MISYGLLGLLLGVAIIAPCMYRGYTRLRNLADIYDIDINNLRKYTNEEMDEYFHKEYRKTRRFIYLIWAIWIFYMLLFVIGFVLKSFL